MAECGSGKSKIGATAMAAVYALRAEQAGRGRQKTFNVILCPSHVANKWVREISETLPDTAGVVVRGNTELDRLYGLYEKGDKSVYAIISKEKARDGFMKQPAVIWNRRQGAYLCPDCMSPIEAPFTEDGIRYTGKVNQFFFRTESSRNHKCGSCGSPLWAPVNPARSGEWVKVGAYGWIHRRRAAEHLRKTKHEPTLEKIRMIAKDPNGYYPTAGACRRYPMSSYLKRRYKGRLDGCIVDELHEYNNDSGQGDAMAEIFSVADRVIGMTATLINGYSSGIFHLLYRVCPGLMMQDGKRHSAPPTLTRSMAWWRTPTRRTTAITRPTAGPTSARRSPGSCPASPRWSTPGFYWNRPPFSPCPIWVRTCPTTRRSRSRWTWRRRSPRACLKNVNMPNRRVFCPLDGAIFPCNPPGFLRKNCLPAAKIPRCWTRCYFSNKP